MKTYNEIYPIEGWADKISKHITKIAEEKPNMYAKTKRRYERLAESLLDSVSKIAIILEEDSLLSKTTDEFDELKDTTGPVSITEKIDKLNQKFHRVEDLSNERDSPSTSSKEAHVSTIDYFDYVLGEASQYNFGYSQVNECAQMLYLWFHTRFRPEISDPTFKYQIHCIPRWISDFILLYGKYHKAKQNKSFVKMIEKWCMDVQSGVVGNYALPYSVYEMDKSVDPSDYTIDAVVINDILSSGCLYKLFDDSFSGVIHYDNNVLVVVVKDKNPSLHSKIVTRIAKRRELIKEIGLTPVGGIDGSE